VYRVVAQQITGLTKDEAIEELVRASQKRDSNEKRRNGT
jgi:hypothetical protein